MKQLLQERTIWHPVLSLSGKWDTSLKNGMSGHPGLLPNDKSIHEERKN
jgi:hypothetical protein